jgi:hypothetical protein
MAREKAELAIQAEHRALAEERRQQYERDRAEDDRMLAHRTRSESSANRRGRAERPAH